ncbi:MAG: Kelch repeat-containing protein [Bacillota bacterium]
MKNNFGRFLMFIVVLSMIMIISCINAFASNNVEIIKQKKYAEKIAAVNEEKVVSTVTKLFKLDMKESSFGKARIKPIVKGEYSSGTPDYLVVYLFHKDVYKAETKKVNLNEDYSVKSIEDNYAETSSDLEPFVGTYNAGISDDEVDAVFATLHDEIPTAVDGVNEAARIAREAGLNVFTIIGDGATIEAYQYWLSKPNVKIFGNIGHGSTTGIYLANGQLSYTYFNSLSSTALNNKVLYFNSCEVHNNPLEGSILNAGVQKYIGGDVSLPIGPSEEVFKYFWGLTITKAQPMTPSLPQAEVETGYADGYYYFVGDHGISGNGSEYLGGSWTRKADMPSERYGTASVSYNNKIYTIGGYSSTGLALEYMQEFDPAANVWTTKANMNSPRADAGAAVLNGKIYAVGGVGFNDFLSSMEEYNPSTNTWTMKANMSTARVGLGVAAVNGKLYAIGGTNYLGNKISLVEEYDPATNTWTTKASMPTARTEFGIAVANNIIYVIGGWDSSNNRISTVEAFDPAKNTWITRASMPTPRYGLTSSVVNGKIYAIGGNVDANIEPNSRRVEEYDPVTNTWITKTKMPTARESLSSAVINNKIYAIGGYTANSTVKCSKVVEEFTIIGSLGSWTSKANTPIARSNTASVAYNNKVYTIGGYNSSGVSVPFMQEFDPVTNTWTSKADMYSPRANGGAAVLNSKIYAVGGVANGAFLSGMEEYNPSTNTWTLKASMSIARMGLGVVEANGKIYAIGGKDSSYNVLNIVEEYDPATNTWTRKANMPTARAYLTVAVVNGKIYAIGGEDSSYNRVNIVEEYDPSTNTWTRKANMPTPRWGLTCSVINNKIYVIGGNANHDVLPCADSVEEYDPATNTWITKAVMKNGRNFLSSAAVNNKIYAIGGNAKGSSVYTCNFVEEFTP